MLELNKKKISISILLITLALISFISKVKIKVEIPTAFDDSPDKNPTEWSVMDVFELFGCTFNYNNTLFVLLLFVIMSILLFIFADDIQISQKINSYKAIVIKWDIKLIVISILVLAFILILGKSCSNNIKAVTPPNSIEEVPVVPYDTTAVAPAAEPVESLTEEEINDSISLNETKSLNNKDSKEPSAFSIIKKQQEQADPAIGLELNH